MNGETMIGFIIYFLVAMIMIGLGISQVRSETPVGFYTGEQPPKGEELSDVKAWNKKHGLMWVIYGMVILITYGAGTTIGDSIWCLIPMCGGVLIPLPVMIWYHHKLIRIYKKS